MLRGRRTTAAGSMRLTPRTSAERLPCPARGGDTSEVQAETLHRSPSRAGGGASIVEGKTSVCAVEEERGSAGMAG